MLVRFGWLILATSVHFSSAASQYIMQQSNPTESLAINPGCVDKVQLVSPSLTGYIKLWALYEQFVFDHAMRFLPICLQLPVAIDTSLECPLDSITNRVQCHSLPALLQRQPKHISQVIVMQSQGNAFVSDGVMHLAYPDNYAILIHELAHFSGFIDEYNMGAAAAAFQCQISHVAPNLIHKQQLLLPEQYPHPFYAQFAARLLVSEPNLMINADAKGKPLSLNQLREAVLVEAALMHEFVGCQRLADGKKRYLLHPNRFNFLRYTDVQHMPNTYRYMWQQQILNGFSATIH
mgnify:CR=1 FL=1